MGKNPSHYKENIPRVSDLVSQVFPFEGKAEEGFRRWLKQKDVSYEDYMKEASEGGRYIHEHLEHYLLKGKQKRSKACYKPFITQGIKAINELGIKPELIEHYFCNEHFQGTIDLVATVNSSLGTKNNELFIIDWKSWGLSKHKFGLHSGYKKPGPKLKKASLQLSLYAMEMKIDKIAVIELDSEAYYLHRLKRIDDDSLNKIIDDYKKNS